MMSSNVSRKLLTMTGSTRTLSICRTQGCSLSSISTRWTKQTVLALHRGHEKHKVA